jgi:serine/threonine protein kinase/Tol biopolymer transport system component
MRLQPGSQLGRYEVRSFIGAGAMGAVYLARDMRLGRPVALKLLLETLVGSREHLRRFEQEACATSSLSHPNILTIHEVCHLEGTHFIVSEFVEGRTLRRVIEGERLTLGEILDVVMQTASGLAAAHQAGIVHRDLKPENVMVRDDGYVKILDFGLAKLTEDRAAHFGGGGDSTVSNLNTNSGEVLGTVRYMSPEQLRGLAVDRRTDIWSLGVVLHELITGRSPFGGGTAPNVIAAILEHQPPPVSACVADFPAPLQRVITKALSKDAGQRYQSAGDLLADLRRFRDEPRHKEWLGKVMLSSQPSDPQTRAAGSGGSHNAIEALNRLVSSTASGATDIITTIGGRRRWLTATLLVLTLAVSLAIARYESWSLAVMFASFVCIVLLLHRVTVQGQLTARKGPFQTIKLSRLTDTGKVVDAVISPDGKYVAYVSEQAGQQSLWVRQVATTANAQVVLPAEVTYQGLSFSPDGDFINYVFYESATKGFWQLSQVPVLGGVPRRLIAEVHTPVTFSPDGRQLAFVRGYSSEKMTALIMAGADGAGERRLATRRTPNEFGWRGGPSWSPAGDRIACAAGVYDVDMEIVEVRVSDGSERPVSRQRWPWVGRVAWLAGGKGLVLTARDPQSGLSQLWHVSCPEGEVRRITNDLNDYSSRSVSLSADSRSLVSVQSDYLSGVWVVPAGGGGQPRQIADGRSDGIFGLAWTPDGRIVYTSRASGRQNIWVMDADGGNAAQLTDGDGMHYHPAVSPDGRHVIFISTRTGEPNVWRVGIGGDNLAQLTRGGNPSWPSWSPDGAWIVYKSQQSGKRTLWALPAAGGDPVHLTDSYTGMPTVSPDGKLIACEYWDEQLASGYKLAVIPFDDGSRISAFDMPTSFVNSIHLSSVLRWRPDGRAVSYIDNRAGVCNIWDYPLDGSPPTQVTDFRSERIFWFDWSPDGRQLACARGLRISDAVLISDAAPARRG